MSQKSSVPQAISFVAQVLPRAVARGRRISRLKKAPFADTPPALSKCSELGSIVVFQIEPEVYSIEIWPSGFGPVPCSGDGVWGRGGAGPRSLADEAVCPVRLPANDEPSAPRECLHGRLSHHLKLSMRYVAAAG